MFSSLLEGVIVGLGASIPLGPLGILCIQKTLSKGRNAGFISGLGATVVDTIYAALALMGLAFIQNLIKENLEYVLIVGGIAISLIGIKIYLTNPIKQIRQKNNNSKNVEDFFQALFITLSNPGAFFLILALFAAVGVDINNRIHENSLVPILWGVFIGSSFWWFALSTTINSFRKKFRIKQLMMLNRIAGIIIVIMGVITFFDGVIELILKK